MARGLVLAGGLSLIAAAQPPPCGPPPYTPAANARDLKSVLFNWGWHMVQLRGLDDSGPQLQCPLGIGLDFPLISQKFCHQQRNIVPPLPETSQPPSPGQLDTRLPKRRRRTGPGVWR